MLLVLLLGCAVYDALFGLLEEPPAPPCAARSAWWEDADGDGVGAPDEAWISCEAPDGWVAEGGDCDDTDPAIVTGCADDTGDTGSDDTGSDDTGSDDTGSDDTDDSGAVSDAPAEPRR